MNQNQDVLAEPTSAAATRGTTGRMPDSEAIDQRLLTRHMLEGYVRSEIICDEHGLPYDYRFLDVNPAFEAMAGITAGDLIGKTANQIFPETEKYWIDIYGAVALSGKAVTFERQLFGNADHFFKIFAYSPATMQFVILCTDISEARQLQDEMKKGRNLRSIGVLVSGIAHDFNNILTGVLGNISLMKMHLRDDKKICGIVREAEKASRRAKQLTNQLLAYSEGNDQQRQALPMAQLIKDTVSFIFSGTGAEHRLSVPDDLWPAIVDEGQLYQVLNSLISNAGEAVSDRKPIEIVAENHTVHGLRAALPQGDYVRVSVSDHGIGIPEGHLARIFEPYFTTKKDREGLGLAVLKGILDEYDGHVQVESTEGSGATFFVYLPASPDAVMVDEPPEALDSPGGSGRILVMDDEEAIRKLMKNYLGQIGYDVEVCDDGLQAMDHYRKACDAGTPFDVVILDLTIPGGGGGREIISQMRKIDATVKAIVSSGYVNDPVINNYKAHGFCAVLLKPYDVRELRKVLRDVTTSVTVEN